MFSAAIRLIRLPVWNYHHGMEGFDSLTLSVAYVLDSHMVGRTLTVIMKHCGNEAWEITFCTHISSGGGRGPHALRLQARIRQLAARERSFSVPELYGNAQ